MLHTHPITSFFSCQYHSTNAPCSSHYFSFPLSVSFHAPYLFIRIPPTLYNVFLPVLHFSPVSIIPPMLHTHPITSVFPCQYHSMLHTYSSVYHQQCIMFFLPVLQFSPVSIIAPILHSFIHYQCCIF